MHESERKIKIAISIFEIFKKSRIKVNGIKKAREKDEKESLAVRHDKT